MIEIIKLSFPGQTGYCLSYNCIISNEKPLLSHSTIYIKLAPTPNEQDSTYILDEFNLQTVTMKYIRMQQPEGMKPT
jgi:hypothetical protein